MKERTPEEKIDLLIAKVALIEARLAALEARPVQTYQIPYYYPWQGPFWYTIQGGTAA